MTSGRRRKLHPRFCHRGAFPFIGNLSPIPFGFCQRTFVRCRPPTVFDLCLRRDPWENPRFPKGFFHLLPVFPALFSRVQAPFHSISTIVDLVKAFRKTSSQENRRGKRRADDRGGAFFDFSATETSGLSGGKKIAEKAPICYNKRRNRTKFGPRRRLFFDSGKRKNGNG